LYVPIVIALLPALPLISIVAQFILTDHGTLHDLFAASVLAICCFA
jgi:hypothetical protein